MEERGALSHTTTLQVVTQNIPQYHYLLGIVKPHVSVSLVADIEADTNEPQ